MGGIEERRRTFDCELNYVAHQLEKFSLCTRIFRGKEFPINSIFLRLKFKQLNEVLARRQLAKENYQAEIILSIKQISSVLKWFRVALMCCSIHKDTKNFKHSAISVSAHSNRMQKLSSILLALTPAQTPRSQGLELFQICRKPGPLASLRWRRRGAGAQDEGKSKPKRKRIALK